MVGLPQRSHTLAFHGSHRSEWILGANHSHSFELTWCAPSGLHSVVMCTMEMPGSGRLTQSFGWGGRNLCCTLSVRVFDSRQILLQIWYVTVQVMKFLGCSRFRLILETYKSNLRIGTQYSRKTYIWLVEDNSYLGPDRTMEIDRTFGSSQCALSLFGPVRTMESQWLCKLWPWPQCQLQAVDSIEKSAFVLRR